MDLETPPCRWSHSAIKSLHPPSPPLPTHLRIRCVDHGRHGLVGPGGVCQPGHLARQLDVEIRNRGHPPLHQGPVYVIGHKMGGSSSPVNQVNGAQVSSRGSSRGSKRSRSSSQQQDLDSSGKRRRISGQWQRARLLTRGRPRQGIRGVAVGIRRVAVGIRGVAVGIRGVAAGIRGVAVGSRPWKPGRSGTLTSWPSPRGHPEGWSRTNGCQAAR